MALQNFLVQLKHRLGEHAYSQVDKPELYLRETHSNLLEQVVGQVGIVAAILSITGHLLWREVHAHLAQCVDNLVALDA